MINRIDFKHQKDVRQKATTENVCMFHDCGAGKTLSSLDIIADLKAKGRLPVLIICPIRLMEDAWVGDANTFYPGLDIQTVYHKNRKKRLKLLYEDHEVQVTNPDTFKNHFDDFMDKGYQAVIKDESSDLKNNRSQTTRATLAVAGFVNRAVNGVKFDHKRRIPIRHALSATPAPNSPAEFWGQIKFITGPSGRVFSDNFYNFRARYFNAIPIGRTGQSMHKFRKDMFTEFCYKLAEVAHVCRKQDIMDLPEQVHNIHDIELSGQEQAAYDKLKRDLVLRLGDETILASTALTEIMKLRQITSGFVYGENGTHRIGSSKLDYQRQLLAQNPTDQQIIWINFKEEAGAFKGLPNSAVLAGDIDMQRQFEIIKEFKAGQIQYLIANQQSVSHGLTFVNCCRSTYFSQNYSYELMKQSQDRTHRIGQTKVCTYNHLLAKKSIDGIIRRATLAKEKMVNEFLGCLVDIQNGVEPNTAGCDTIFNQSHTQVIKKSVMGHIKGVA